MILKLKITKAQLKKWSQDVKATTDGLCALCGSSNRVESHHIVRRGTIPHAGWLMVENGIPLCFKCHYDGIHSMSFEVQQLFKGKIQIWLYRRGLSYKKLEEMIKTGL